MKPELSNVIAHIQGNGCVNKRNNRTELIYYNKEPSLIKDFRKNFKKQFGVEAWKPCFRKTAIATGTGRSEIVGKLKKFQLIDWRVPEEIFKSKKETQKIYLRAFFDDEGTVTLVKSKKQNKNGTFRKFLTRKIKLYSKSLKGLEDVKKLLISFKIKSNISKPKNREVYELDISNIKSNIEFF